MIGRLSGLLIGDETEGVVTLDVAGVGYDLAVPLGTVGRAKAKSSDGKVTLFVHTHLRQDALELFGFSSELERKVFRLLLGVPNIGPKIALAVLGSLPAPELAQAVVKEDTARLNKIPGVGKKTADRLVLELREKLLKLGPVETAQKSEPSAGADGEKLMGALINMGYRQPEAERAVTSLKARLGKEPLAELLRAALGELSA
ncbi:MAG TPA: Holliday junction branch migration protein RuvA [Polyangiaceae bacterium]|jgi:Holliday junction DNA helicase RuvA|nr:Holliday junction branch migration protein RuvA [Polyangiaceae bacterium]